MAKTARQIRLDERLKGLCVQKLEDLSLRF